MFNSDGHPATPCTQHLSDDPSRRAPGREGKPISVTLTHRLRSPELPTA